MAEQSITLNSLPPPSDVAKRTLSASSHARLGLDWRLAGDYGRSHEAALPSTPASRIAPICAMLLPPVATRGDEQRDGRDGQVMEVKVRRPTRQELGELGVKK